MKSQTVDEEGELATMTSREDSKGAFAANETELSAYMSRD